MFTGDIWKGITKLANILNNNLKGQVSLIFTELNFKPLYKNQLKNLRGKGVKGLGHMIEMTVTPIYGNPFKFFFCRTRSAIILACGIGDTSSTKL